MTSTNIHRPAHEPWPHWLRWGLIVAAVAILCSCRAPQGGSMGIAALDDSEVTAARQQSPDTLPPQAYTGVAVPPGSCPVAAPPAFACPPPGYAPQAAYGCPMGPPGMEQGVPLPYAAYTPWAPPGLGCPWPQDEFICDGGDRNAPAGVADNWRVDGLDTEDTIAHYDTVDGHRVVEPSNRVCIYSPRFRAVRQVVGLVGYQQNEGLSGVESPLRLARQDDVRPPLMAKQQVQLEGQVAANPPVAMLSKQGDGALSTAVKAIGFQDAFLPYEDMRVIRSGVLEASEMAALARNAQAAEVWQQDQAVQVILDEQRAAEVAKDQEAISIYTSIPSGKPQLRLIKVASTPFAQPGDEIDFTLRFDNIGTQVIGNVTLLDNLSPRLEYVPDSAQCSLDARFTTQQNESGSLTLRCEIEKPLDAGQGGIVRFRCKVR